MKERVPMAARRGARPKRTAWYGEAEQQGMAVIGFANYRVNF
jgi:hypothetical protein